MFWPSQPSDRSDAQIILLSSRGMSMKFSLCSNKVPLRWWSLMSSQDHKVRTIITLNSLPMINVLFFSSAQQTYLDFLLSLLTSVNFFIRERLYAIQLRGERTGVNLLVSALRLNRWVERESAQYVLVTTLNSAPLRPPWNMKLVCLLWWISSRCASDRQSEKVHLRRICHIGSFVWDVGFLMLLVSCSANTCMLCSQSLW